MKWKANPLDSFFKLINQDFEEKLIGEASD